jgi:hypothetical protein
MNSLSSSAHCSKRQARPAQRIEVQPVEDSQGAPSGPQYAVIECDEDDSVRWLRSGHPTAHEAAYAAAKHSATTGLPLWFPRIDGAKHPVLQALEDVLFAEGVIAYCTRTPETLWHQVQRAGYNAAAARYPELAGKEAK